MRVVTIKIEGLTPYSASNYLSEEKPKDETYDDYENRMWKKKAHVDENGIVFIPGTAFKLALDEVASLLNEQKKGMQTWGLQFAAGVVAVGDVSLGIHIDAVKAVEIFAHANGKRGPGTRVFRKFPIIMPWRGELEMRVFNDAIGQEKFEEYFTQAGILAGVGRGRPITKSPAGNGRFKPVQFAWGNE